MRLTAMVIALMLGIYALPVQAGETDRLEQGWDTMRDAGNDLLALAENAVVAGGVLLYRHRHAVSGGVLGCAAGATLGAALAASAGVATGGAAFAGAPQAAAIGCGVGAAAGIAAGRPMDEVFVR